MVCKERKHEFFLFWPCNCLSYAEVFFPFSFWFHSFAFFWTINAKFKQLFLEWNIKKLIIAIIWIALILIFSSYWLFLLFLLSQFIYSSKQLLLAGRYICSFFTLEGKRGRKKVHMNETLVLNSILELQVVINLLQLQP